MRRGGACSISCCSVQVLKSHGGIKNPPLTWGKVLFSPLKKGAKFVGNFPSFCLPRKSHKESPRKEEEWCAGMKNRFSVIFLPQLHQHILLKNKSPFSAKNITQYSDMPQRCLPSSKECLIQSYSFLQGVLHQGNMNHF